MSELVGTNTVPLHTKRAGEHLRMAEAMVNDSPEWCRVAAFYSAYHSMKAALLVDPVFTNPTKLAAANTNITMGSNLATHHQGNLGRGRGLGINDLVRFLYRPHYGSYLLLHGASLSIRYGDGQLLHTPEECIGTAQSIYVAFQQGAIVHS